MGTFIYNLAQGLKPDRYYKNISDIDLSELKSRNIKAFIIDLDNTVLPWKSNVIPDSSLAWIDLAKSQGFAFFILSNTINTKRLGKIASQIGCNYIHPALKPRKKSFISAALSLGFLPSEIAVVGDQIFTDIKGGKKAGMYTILVDPISKREFIGTKYISRSFENLLKKYMLIF